MPNTWDKSAPYWEWVCTEAGCKVETQRYRNQTGDPTCSWCGHRRVYIGHFEPVPGGKNTRRNLDTGEVIRNDGGLACVYSQIGTDRTGVRDRGGNIYG